LYIRYEVYILISKDDLLEAYRLHGTFDRAAVALGINRKSFSRYWYENELPDPSTIMKEEHPKSETYTVAAISDMHWGSIYQNMDAFQSFIDEVKSRNIQTLLCCGDTVDGLLKRPNAENERFLHSIDDIMEYAIKYYPRGFKNNILINGNHCASLDIKGDGFNFARNLCRARTDLKCVVNPSMLAEPIVVEGGAKMVLYHGAGACSGNLTTRTRSLVTKLVNHNVPFDIACAGHCHSSSSDYYLGKWAFSLDCFENMTPYLATKMLVPYIGGLILTYEVNEYGRVTKVIPENIRYDEVIPHDY
jgi:predicted phosphodiesterase